MDQKENHGRVRMVAAVIKWHGRYLLQQRDPRGSFPFAWCSPGGKGEPGEDDASALARELREECGIDAKIGEFLFEYGDRTRVVRFYAVDQFTGTPKDRVGVGLGWFSREERAALAMTVADDAFRAREVTT